MGRVMEREKEKKFLRTTEFKRMKEERILIKRDRTNDKKYGEM